MSAAVPITSVSRVPSSGGAGGVRHPAASHGTINTEPPNLGSEADATRRRRLRPLSVPRSGSDPSVAAVRPSVHCAMTEPTLPRVLGLGQLVAIVIGAIIGVGIFFTPAQVAQIAGSAPRALLLWTLGGVSAAMGAVVFAELGRRFPHAGGQYRVVR